MARNDFRSSPGGSARDRRAAYYAKIGPQVVSGSIPTAQAAVTVDGSGLLELGYNTSELIPVAANQVINGIYTTEEGAANTVGGKRWLQFQGGCTLVYDATYFQLPGDASIVTVAGDIGLFYCAGGTPQQQGEWVCVEFSRGGVPPNPGYGQVVCAAMTFIIGDGTLGTDYTYSAAGYGGPGDTLTIPLSAAFPNPAIGVRLMSFYATADTNLLFVLNDNSSGVYTYTSGDGSTTPFVWTRAAELASPVQFPGAIVVVQANTWAGLWYCLNAETYLPQFPPTVSLQFASFSQSMTFISGGYIYVGSGTENGLPVAVSMSGDATIASNGVITLSTAGGSTLATYVASQLNDYDIKLAVRACAQGNLNFTRSGNNYTAGTIGVLTQATIDAGWSGGTTLSVGDRILLANQTSNVDNGIVTITSLGTIGTDATLARAADMNTSAEVTSEMRVPISEGTDANLDYKLSSAGPFTLNTTALPFTKAGGPPTGPAGGSLSGTYPNPAVATNANLTGPITSSGNATAVATSFALPGQATPAASKGACVYDTTQKTFLFGAGVSATPINLWMVGAMFTSTTQVSSTTTAQTITMIGAGTGTMTIPANAVGVGSTFRLRMKGTWTTGTTAGTWNWLIQLAGTTAASTGAQTPIASLTGHYWELEVDLIVNTSSNAGIVYIGGKFTMLWNIGVGSVNSESWPIVPTAAGSIDLTSTCLIDVKLTTSNGNDTITSSMVTLERMM